MAAENPIPQIIEDINKFLAETIPKNRKHPTVEEIAAKIGIGTQILCDWVMTDTEFADTLARWKTIQENDPFKTGTSEDSWVGSLLIALILIETRDRHYKPPNI